MNRIYRPVWNEKTGTFVAVSENTRSAGKKVSSATRTVGADAHCTLKVLAISLLMTSAANVCALPVGGVVTAGNASIGSNASGTTITQTTQNAAINWQSFNIAAGETVRFLQPNSNSVALNRVLGATPSSIFGNLSANGKVFLVNPNGILFGNGAQVNVGGLVASTLNISDHDFMAGTYNFSGASNGTVLNQGAINADGGYVALLGAHVSNDGTLSARLGTVVLAAGAAITLDVAGDGLLNVVVNQGAVNALVQNDGLLRADGGHVLLTAQAAGNLLQSAVNNTGVIQAQSIENHNGTIRLLGDMKSGTVNISGTLDVSGTGAGQTGGSVTVTAQHVALLDGQIDASGDAGGGTVLVGGGLHGANTNVQNASATYMGANAAISADALTSGSGGTVVLWANDATRAYGSISTRGGTQSGDGGLIETSGRWLDVSGLHVDAAAVNGRSGAWLLDPNNVTIQTAGTETGVTTGPNFTSTDDNAIVTTATIEAALNAGTSVIITTGSGGADTQAGNINVSGTLAWDAPTAATTLTLNATQNVNVGATVTATTGSFAANAGNDVNVSAAMKTTTGNLAFSAGNDVNLNAATTIVSGNLTALAGHDVNVAAAVTVTTGGMVLRADNDGTGPGAIVGGTVAITCGANCLTLTTGILSIRFNPVAYADTDSEITSYAANLTGGGTLDAKAWVFVQGNNKIYDGTAAATLSFAGDPAAGVNAVSLSPGTAAFDTRNAGTGKTITYSGYSLGGADAGQFALFSGAGTATANIAQAPLTINAVTDSRIYNGATSSAGIVTYSGLQTGDSLTGLTQTYASKNVLGANLSTLNVDGYTLTDGNAGGNYNVTLNTAAGTITPAPLGIAANSATRLYGDANPAFSATYTGFQNGETAAVLTGTLALVTPAVPTSNVGSYAITPSGQSSGNYTIIYVNGILGITPAPLGIAANSATRLYGDANPAFSATYTGFQNGETAAALTGTLALTTPAVPTSNVGNYAITPSGQSSANYSIAYVNGTLGVTPAPLGIAANSTSKIYGSTVSFTGAEFSSTGLKNGETIGSATLASAGAAPTAGVADSPYIISISAAGGGTFSASNYAISYVSGALGVTPAPLGIVANSTSKTFGDTVSFTGAEFSSTGLKNGETIGSVSLSSTGTVPTAGVADSPYVISISAASGGTFNAVNYTITYVDGALGVLPAGLLGIAANAVAKTYDGLAYSGGNGVTYTGFQGADTPASLSGTLVYGGSSQGAVNVGSYTIIPSGQSSPNYTISYINGTLSVIPAPLGIAANSTARLYGDANPAFSATYTGFQNGETAAVLTGALALTTLAVPTSNVGNYNITPSGQSAANYTITYVNGILGITPAPLGIAANSISKVYGSTVSFTGTEFGSTGLKNGETIGSVTLASAGAAPTSGVADSPYVIAPSNAMGGTFSASNYTISYVNGALGITPAPLGVAAHSATRLYGDANPAFSPTYTGFQNGETAAVLAGTLALTTPAVPTSNVGNYAITPSGQSSANYSITYVNGILGVTPAPLDIAANSISKIYGGTVSFTGTEFGSAGLKNGETIGSVTLVSAGAAPTAGVANSPYVISISAARGGTFSASNYTISYVSGALGITPAALTVTASNASKTYGEIPALTAFTAAGLVNGETIASVTETSPGAAAIASVAGSPYAITPSNATGGTFNASNYAITYVDGILAVTPLATQPAIPPSIPVSQPAAFSGYTPPGAIQDDPENASPDWLDLAVIDAGVGMPLTQLVDVAPVESLPVQPVPVTVPIEIPAKIDAPPQHPRKQDRN